MKLDMTQGLTGFDGTPLEDEGTLIVLRTVCINALLATLEDDRNRSGEDKLTAWVLAKRLYDEDTPDLKVEEVASLKQRVGECFSPSVVGPALGLLDGAEAA